MVGIFWETEWAVYENWGVDRATVHIESCGFYNLNGSRGASSSLNGRWLGPFRSREVALGVAEALDRDQTHACLHCLAS